MTEEEYYKIKEMITKGVTLKRACDTPARKTAFCKMRRRLEGRRESKESLPPSLAKVAPYVVSPSIAPPSVAAVLREAAKAANDPMDAETLYVSRYPAQKMDDDFDSLPTDPREILIMIKKAVVRQMRSRAPDSSWGKLGLLICEHEIPEWSSKAAKVAKDEYQDILESVFKSSTGFKILERKNNGRDNKPEDAGKAGSPG